MFTKKEDILEQYNCILSGFYDELQEDPPREVMMRLDIQGRVREGTFKKNKVVESYYRPQQPVEKEIVPGLKLKLDSDEVVHLCLDFTQPAENSVIQIRVLKINRTKYQAPHIVKGGSVGRARFDMDDFEARYPYKASLNPVNFELQPSHFEGLLSPVGLVSKLITPVTDFADEVLETVDISGVLYKNIKGVAKDMITGSLNKVRITPPNPDEPMQDLRQGKVQIEIGGRVLFGAFAWSSSDTYLPLDTKIFLDDTPERREQVEHEAAREALEKEREQARQKYMNEVLMDYPCKTTCSPSYRAQGRQTRER